MDQEPREPQTTKHTRGSLTWTVGRRLGWLAGVVDAVVTDAD